MSDKLLSSEEVGVWKVETYQDANGRTYTRTTLIDGVVLKNGEQIDFPPTAFVQKSDESTPIQPDLRWVGTKSEGIMVKNRVSSIQETFDKLLFELKQLKELAGRSEDGRQAAIVFTQVELAEAYFKVKFGGVA